MKRLLKWAGFALLGLVLLLAIVPFLIPVRPLTGLSTPEALAGADDRFVTLPFDGTDGIDIRYREAGDPNAARTFVLIHGSVFNADTWDQVMNDFASRGRVIAYDRLPYGLSEKVQPGDWTGAPPMAQEAVTRRVFQLMDALDIERAVLVGNSYGSVVAVRAAAMTPDRVEALVLSDAAVYIDESLPDWVMRLPQVARLGPLLARAIGGSETFIRSTWANPDAMPDARLEKTLQHTRVQGWDTAFFNYLQNWRTPDMTPQIARLNMPSLVLTGALDQVVPVADSERLHATLPDSDYVVLPDCGHVPQEECPEAFATAVLAWEAKLP